MLARAIEIAATAHKNQTDKAGAPYILHPLRIMMKMQSDEEKIVAVLHDVIEDCPDWTLERLDQEGYSPQITDAIDCLTHRDGEDYGQFIERASQNSIARKVKLADIEDNMNLLRMHELCEKDWQRLQKYHHAWHKLDKKHD